VAILAYGWIAELELSLSLFLLSNSFVGFSLILCVLPMMAYVVDAFGLYSASAITSVIIARCLMSTFLPLILSPLLDAFSYGKGFTILAGGTLCLAPIPIMLYRLGSGWRQHSIYTKEG
jgi:hypothetical protein